MVFFKNSLIISLIFISATLAHAQADTGCTPGQLSNVPELKSLRPGMTVDEVKAVVPSLEMGMPDEFGLSKTSFSPDFNPKINKAAFQGVRTVSLDFLDGRVSSIWIGYNETSRLKSIEDVVKAMSQALKLRAAWETKGRGQQVTCGELAIYVNMVAGSPTLRITDETARETWEKRRTAKEEQEP